MNAQSYAMLPFSSTPNLHLSIIVDCAVIVKPLIVVDESLIHKVSNS